MNSSIFNWFQLIAENAWLYGGSFVLVLTILVFVHEWGHYIVARMCGVHIETFSIGFGKEMFGITDKSGTRWKFSMVPLGGYVKMFGDTDPASAGHIDGIEEKGAAEKGAAESAEESAEKLRPLTEKEKKEAFFSQSVKKRFAIVLAGPAINFIFAIILMTGLYSLHGQPVTPPVASAIMGGSAAESAGFQPHDEIIAIDKTKIQSFEDIRREVLVGLDAERKFTIMREGQTIEIMASPDRLVDKDRFGFKSSRGLLGLISPGNAMKIDSIKAIDGLDYTDSTLLHQALIERLGTTFKIALDRGSKIDEIIIRPLQGFNEGLYDKESPSYDLLDIADREDESFVKYPPLVSLSHAVTETVNITLSTLKALGQMVSGTRSATELGGIIRIGAIAGDMAQAGIFALITFTALLSINLGLINLFPIPMLDGGHLFFFLIEGLKGSPLSEQIQEYAFRLGLAILVGIMIFANLNDIIQLVL